jgi:chaperonin GroEL
MENVLFNEECREKLIKGINLAAKVAQVTFGPNGHTVLGGQHPTKDGMTAISWLYDSDPYVNTGINLMKELTAKTAEVAGDNTTTTALLANEIITKCNTSDSKQLKESLDLVIKYLQSQKRIIKSFQDLVNVATLAANGDEHIGELVAEAFAKVKEDGVVTFSESEDVFDRVDYSQGFRITNGFSSPKFINTPQGTCELTDVYVHISDTKMEEITEVVNIADKCMKMHKSLLLMAPDFDSEIYVFLQSNLDLLKSCTVISPAFKAHRDILVKDIKALLGDSQIC